MKQLNAQEVQSVSAGFEPELAGSFMGVATGAYIGGAIGLPCALIGGFISYNLQSPYFYYGMAASSAIIPCSIIMGAISGGVTGYFSGYTANQVYQYFKKDDNEH